MVFHSEETKPSMLAVPVAANALKAGSAIMESVRQNSNLCFG
jgi:hypothetical protein